MDLNPPDHRFPLIFLGPVDVDELRLGKLGAQPRQPERNPVLLEHDPGGPPEGGAEDVAEISVEPVRFGIGRQKEVRIAEAQVVQGTHPLHPLELVEVPLQKEMVVVGDRPKWMDQVLRQLLMQRLIEAIVLPGLPEQREQQGTPGTVIAAHDHEIAHRSCPFGAGSRRTTPVSSSTIRPRRSVNACLVNW